MALGTMELLLINNRGLIPIKELIVKIDLTIEKTNESIVSGVLKWQRKHQFNPKETSTVQLHEKLKGLFEKNKLIRTVEGMTVPYNDPDTGEEMEYTAHPACLKKPFTLMLNLQIEANIEDEIKIVVRKYRLDYSWLDDFQEGYDDDYRIAVSDHTGEWIE